MEDTLKDAEASSTPLLYYVVIKQWSSTTIYACLMSVYVCGTDANFLRDAALKYVVVSYVLVAVLKGSHSNKGAFIWRSCKEDESRINFSLDPYRMYCMLLFSMSFNGCIHCFSTCSSFRYLEDAGCDSRPHHSFIHHTYLHT